jgi:hypothetical protein
MFRIFGYTLLFVMMFSSCRKKTQVVVDNIPYQTVNITIYPNDPLYFKLQSVGGWVYINGGINGIIVYRKTDVGASDFVAIERTSSHLPDNADAKVKVQSDNFTLKDTISGSSWRITDGVVLTGPADRPLRLYNTLYDNGSLTIRN